MLQLNGFAATGIAAQPLHLFFSHQFFQQISTPTVQPPLNQIFQHAQM
jgi:hypothetical protein